MKKNAIRPLLLAFPAFLGFCMFYILPMVWSLHYSVIDNNFNKRFVGLSNFEKLFRNESFLLALKNTLMFSVIGVAVIILFSIIISIFFIESSRRFSFLRFAFIMPLLLPTAGTAIIFRNIFNRFGELTQIHVSAPTLLQMSILQVLPVCLIFIWKYSGLNIILLISAISKVDSEIYEASSLDGASKLLKHFYITIPIIRPTLFFATVLSFVNAFKIYKEIYYLFDGDYPPDAVYFLQHFMNNSFRKINYQNLSVSAIIFTVIVLSVVLIFYTGAKRGAEE